MPFRLPSDLVRNGNARTLAHLPLHPLALVLFATLAVIFGVVTVDQFGTKQYVTDNLSGLPPVYVLSALLVVPCLAFVFAFWMLFMDAFKSSTRSTPPGPPQVELPRSLLGRLRVWRRAH